MTTSTKKTPVTPALDEALDAILDFDVEALADSIDKAIIAAQFLAAVEGPTTEEFEQLNEPLREALVAVRLLRELLTTGAQS